MKMLPRIETAANGLINVLSVSPIEEDHVSLENAFGDFMEWTLSENCKWTHYCPVKSRTESTGFKKLIELHRAGLGPVALAKRFGIARKTVSRILTLHAATKIEPAPKGN